MLRRIGVGLVTAVFTGLLVGAVARLMMRLVALSVGHETHFSPVGTALILIVFAVVSVPGSLLAALWSGRGRSTLLVLGALLLAFVASGVAKEDLGSVGALSALEWTGLVLAVLALFAAVLCLPVVALRLIRVGLAITSRGPSEPADSLTRAAGHV